MKRFDEKHSKDPCKELLGLADRITTAATKLGSFKKDMDIRKRAVQFIQAEKGVEELEQAVKMTQEATTPFGKKDKQDSEMTAECEALALSIKTAQAKLDEAKTALSAQQRLATSLQPQQRQVLVALSKRVTNSTADLTKCKQVADEHLAGFRKKEMLDEAGEKVNGIDDIVKAATDACDPILKENCAQFLVESSIQALAEVLREWIAKGQKSKETIFKEICKGSNDLSQDAFEVWLEKLPDALACDTIVFSEERRAAIFKVVAPKGKFGFTEFTGVLETVLKCLVPVTLTKGLSAVDSETLMKLEPGQVLRALSAKQTDETTAMTRIECEVIETKTKGFVTMIGGDGKPVLEEVSALKDFATELNGKFAEATREVTQILTWFKTTLSQIPGQAPPALAEARLELTKMRNQAQQALQSIKTLQAAVNEAKKEFSQRVQQERLAPMLAREQRQSDEIKEQVSKYTKAVETASKQLQECAQPMVNVKESDLEAFQHPKTTIKELQRLHETLAQLLVEAREALQNHQESVKSTMKGPLLEARKEIFKANHSLTLIERKADSAVESCSEKASTLATQRYEEVSRKLRDQAASDKLTVVAYVEKVFGDNLLLSEAAFIACVEKSGLTIQNEQIGLIFDSFERPDGLDRRKMIAFIQQHWVVLKTIALTDEFEISKCKTLRKVEAE
jgi:hypothetical protein